MRPVPPIRSSLSLLTRTIQDYPSTTPFLMALARSAQSLPADAEWLRRSTQPLRYSRVIWEQRLASWVMTIDLELADGTEITSTAYGNSDPDLSTVMTYISSNELPRSVHSRATLRNLLAICVHQSSITYASMSSGTTGETPWEEFGISQTP